MVNEGYQTMTILQEKQYPSNVLSGLDMDKLAKEAVNHFPKPADKSQKAFEQQIKQELLNGEVNIVMREITFRRKFA